MLRLLLILIVSIIYISSPAQEKQENYNLLWKIKGNNLTEPSFLFGTMHVSDKRAFNYSDSVMLAIEQVDAFALEIEPDAMVGALFSEMFETKDSTDIIKKILSEEEYERLSKRVEDELGIPMDKLNMNNPMLIEMMLERSGKEAFGDSLLIGAGKEKPTFVDAYLYSIAKSLGKITFGLEEIEDQLEMFTNISKEEQRNSLMRVIDTSSTSRLLRKMKEEEMIKIYNEGDVGKIEEFIGKRWMDDPVMVKRNKIMTASIDSVIQNKSLFAAVGAAHLPGDEGIIKLLEAKGYQLSPVKATFTGIADNYEIDYAALEWKTYTDKASGFSVETPAELFELDLFEGMDMLMTWEIGSGAFYGVFKVPVPYNLEGAEIEQAFYENIAEGYKRDGVELISNEVIEAPGGKAAEIVFKQIQKNTTQKMRFFIRYGKVTGLFMGNSAEVINQPYADRFFNSFQSFEPENYKPPTLPSNEVPTNWVDYKNDEFAFSVKLPNLEIEDQTQEQELEGFTEKVIINMFYVTDTVSQANYFVRYSDFPLGMYAEYDALDETLSQMISQSDEVGEIDTVWNNGYEGRSFNVKFKNFPMKGQVFVRGNRTYALLQQRFLPNNQDLAAQYFFDSFKMEPYQQDTFQTIQSDTFLYKIEVPSLYKIHTPTSYEDNSYYGVELDHTLYGKDPYSAGVYSLNSIKYNNFHRVNNIDSLYSQLVYNTVEYSDTIIKELEIEKNGIKGKEYHIAANNQTIYRRLQFYLHNQYVYQLDVYDSNKELFSKNAEHFFNSFEMADKPEYNIEVSKTDAILKGLHSTDSLLYKKSKYALTNYYEFIEEDVEPLLTAIKQTYKMDTGYTKIASSLFDNLEPLLNKTHLPELTNLYRQYKDSTYLSSNILSAIAEVDSIDGYKTYLNLLVNETPKESNYYTFAPLNDSLQFATDNYTKLLSLLNDANHRQQIVGLTNTLCNDEEDKHKSKIKNHLAAILDYALKDVEDYKVQEDEYKSWHVTNYLSIIEAANNKKLGKKFAKNLLKKEPPAWIKAELAEYYLSNNLKIKPIIIDTLLANKETKLRTIKALYGAGQIKQIPQQYLAVDAFSKLALDSYLYYDYSSPNTLTLTGKLKKPEGTYYVYKLNYEDEEIEYIGIVGPFDDQNINSSYQCLANWDEIEEDWEKQAELLIEEFLQSE